ncbi:MAG TPA: PspA/IM30 family protein [Corynebacterium sp.]|nr:PspA/IM30 family protein [Corynebacterium sp.]
MANPFTKGWKYLMASFDQKIDESADPRVQIHQAVEAAKKRHREITEQAASILGNKRQLEMQMDRLRKSQDDYADKARSALQLADEAAAAGDSEKSTQFANTAEVLATQLVAVEQELEQTRTMHEQAAQAAEQAQAQQQQSEARLKEQLAEVNKLMAQADQADMQQKSSEAMQSINTSLAPDNAVPTLDGVRDKIERRYAEALGQQELLGNTVNDRMSEIASAGTDMKASAKLDEIRASLREENAEQTALETGEPEQSAIEDAEIEEDTPAQKKS